METFIDNDKVNTAWNTKGPTEQLDYINEQIELAKSNNDDALREYWESNRDNVISRKPIIKSDDLTYEVEELKNYNYYYNELIKTVNRLYDPREVDKKAIIGEIYCFEGYLVKSVKDENECNIVLTQSQNDLVDKKFKLKIQKELKRDLLSKFNKQNKTMEMNHGITYSIGQLKSNVGDLSESYEAMLEDGIIDDSELKSLIEKMTNLLDQTKSLKHDVSNLKESQILDLIIEEINGAIDKMSINGVKQVTLNYEQ